MSTDVEVAVVGAGPGGISAAHHLLRRGITDFVILERADDFGGTWRDNHYPGLAVDLPGVFYQLSFTGNPDWSRVFPTDPEIGAYLRRTARELGLYHYLRPGCTVTQQRWQQNDARWRLEIAGRPAVTARFMLNAVGGYINPDRSTALPGVDDFTGTVLRPNDWDDGCDVRGKRVAVVGTGSSGVQIASALADRAAHRDVYLRTPAWILPKVDSDVPDALKRIQRIPGVLAALNLIGRVLMDTVVVILLVHVLSWMPERLLTTVLPIYDIGWRAFYRALLRLVVDDPTYRRALAPRYGTYAKGPVISSSFLPALNRDTVNLITTPIQRVTETGVLNKDSVHNPADLLCWPPDTSSTPTPKPTGPEVSSVATIWPRGSAATACAVTPEPATPSCEIGGTWSGRADIRRTGLDRLGGDHRPACGAHDRRGPTHRPAHHRRDHPGRVRQVEQPHGPPRPHLPRLRHQVQPAAADVLRELPRRNPVLPAANHPRITIVRPPLTAARLRFQVAGAPAPTALPGNETEAPTAISAMPASEENGVRIR
ncbi:flavin-containing monooxygenase [Mycobacterium sp. MUNTM1]